MGRQFTDVSSRYGAPMGRREMRPTEPCKLEIIRVRMVDGDYDDGGAYWGGGIHVQPLYCVRDKKDGEVQLFYRANSRQEVKERVLAEYADVTIIEEK